MALYSVTMRIGFELQQKIEADTADHAEAIARYLYLTFGEREFEKMPPLVLDTEISEVVR